MSWEWEEGSQMGEREEEEEEEEEEGVVVVVVLGISPGGGGKGCPPSTPTGTPGLNTPTPSRPINWCSGGSQARVYAAPGAAALGTPAPCEEEGGGGVGLG